ncbi:hypothetical protein SADUNF_Sadunf13G0040200 [Salix dunnii]|uniref:Uncharacterized protein n=1 Tax=Salix dunnii TaxID=1413687 RepID=A0A835JNC7_9ROSI|nr:hypothetical protein SADUNF_Sadunf13G0040200 [Salix dunnii]
MSNGAHFALDGLKTAAWLPVNHPLYLKLAIFKDIARSYMVHPKCAKLSHLLSSRVQDGKLKNIPPRFIHVLI